MTSDNLSPIMGRTRSRTSPRPNAANATPPPHLSGIGQSDNQPQDEDQAEISTVAGDGQETDKGGILESKFDSVVTRKESGGKENKKKQKKKGKKKVRMNAMNSSLL